MIPHDKIPYFAPGRFDNDDSWSYNRPPRDRRLQVMIEDDKGSYVIPFNVMFDGYNFVNMQTKETLEVDVKAWRSLNRRH